MQTFWLLARAGVLAWPSAALAAAPAVVPPAVVLPAALVQALTTRTKPEIDAGLRRRLRSAVLARAVGVAWDSDCEQDQRDSGALAGLSRQRLADGSWLLRLDCAAGAYQGSFWVAQLWAQAGRWHGAALAWPVARAGAAADAAPVTLSQQVVLWGELAVLPGGAVEVVNRFRGLGDCGTRSAYDVKQGRVRFVVLAAVLACPDTPASVPLGPPDWPILKSFGQ